jgi:histidine triad (HIT) family protein
MEKNIFEKIRDKEAPANIVYQYEYITAFDDIYPDAPIHILIIPNKKIVSLNNIEEEDTIYLTKILLTAKKLVKQFNIDESGYRLISNCNKL